MSDGYTAARHADDAHHDPRQELDRARMDGPLTYPRRPKTPEQLVRDAAALALPCKGCGVDAGEPCRGLAPLLHLQRYPHAAWRPVAGSSSRPTSPNEGST